MSVFNYILEKIKLAKFIEEPFRHLYIQDLLSDEHFASLISDKQVHFDKLSSTREVISKLLNSGYKLQPFPGCISSIQAYLDQIENNKWIRNLHGNPIEATGVTFRLHKYDNPFVEELVNFLNSNDFHECLRDKFEIEEKTELITAIQKNLSHYEISPHPDIRKKALTYLVNINKNEDFSSSGQHTHLLEFTDEYKYIYDYWEKNEEVERCWVPWNWCNTTKQHTQNNSIVMFEPSNRTLHAVKLNYDHAKEQRTQLYGNLMYSDRQRCKFDKNKYEYLESIKKKEKK